MPRTPVRRVGPESASLQAAVPWCSSCNRLMGEMVRCAGEVNYFRYYKRLGQNPKIGCQEFNGLEPPKPSKKQLCDRTKHATRGIDFEAVGDPGSGRGHL